ncbi:MAG: oligopeptide/dipeptide ABC transporter ATP-binding protein [Streptomycetales bacterium]
MALPTTDPTADSTADSTAAASAAGGPGDALLDVRDLRVHFAIHGNFVQRLIGRESGAVKAVDGVSFGLREGEVLGIVGESGSGKTTLGRTLLGLAPATSGSIKLRGAEIARLPERRFRPLRRRMQMIFQDPHAALNPAMDIGTALAHPLQIHGLTRSEPETQDRVRAALEHVGLAPIERFIHKYPSDLSGGQKQRAVIARAIILGPELLVADEPVSMLDMSVRAKILELLLDLRRELGLTYVYITHDLATAKFFCDRVAIMYLGRIVELGPVEQIYADPQHPYTQALIRAIPDPDPAKAVARDLPRGEVPDAINPPLGCSFHPRCPKAFEVCGWESRDLRQLLEQRWVQAGEEIYEAERALIGDLGALDTPSERVTVPAGRSPQELLELFEAIRGSDPDEPLWKGVRRISAVGNGVEVEFFRGIDPTLNPAGGSEAACLLHDAGARAQARDLAAEQTALR